MTVLDPGAAAPVRLNLLARPTAIRRGAASITLPAVGGRDVRVCVARGCGASVVYERDLRLADGNPTVLLPDLTDALKDGTLYTLSAEAWGGDGVRRLLGKQISFAVGCAWVSTAGIWAPERQEEGSTPDFAFLRHDFSVSPEIFSRIVCAHLSVTAVSPEPTRQYVYSLSVNGTEAGVGPCRLGRTPVGEVTLPYATYDVTSLLRAGKNIIAAACYTTAEHAFLCQLTCYGADGAPVLICNSGRDAAEWLALGGDAVFGKDNSIGTSYFTAHACNIHASLYPFGYDAADFIPDSRWASARLVTDDICAGRPLIPDGAEPMRRYPADERVTVEPSADGMLIDLGAEIIGGLALTLNNPTDAPVALTLDFGEQTIPDGRGGRRVKIPMNTGNRYRETWTIAPGEQTLESLSMMAYRYVGISGLPAGMTVTPADVCGLSLRKPFSASDSTLSTDHALLSDIIGLTKHTVKVTSQDIYVDSQSRERGAYEGDLLINMLAAYATEASFAPARLTAEYLLGHRTWPADYLLCIIFAARADYMATGDTRLISAWYDTLKGNLFTEWEDETGLLAAPAATASHSNAILVDWPPSERDGYDMQVTYNTVLCALQVRGYAEMAELAEAIGKHSDAAALRTRGAALKAAMLCRLYDPARGVFIDGLYADGTPSPHAARHATAYALNAGVYGDAAMADRMAEAVFGEGKLHVSVYAAHFLLEGLYRVGRGDLANRLLLDPDTSDGARTWAYMLYRMGATVTTEAWNEQNKPNMTLSHPWGATPAYLFAAGICGITPTKPGYAAVEIAPAPYGIGTVDATLPTIRGPIRVVWETEASPCGDICRMTVTLPPDTEATVRPAPGVEVTVTHRAEQ